jgi:hypothetical protein
VCVCVCGQHCSKIGAEEATALAPALRRMTALKTLNLVPNTRATTHSLTFTPPADNRKLWSSGEFGSVRCL